MDRNGNGNDYCIHEYGNIFFGLEETNQIQNSAQDEPENGWDDYRMSVLTNEDQGVSHIKPKYQQFAIKSVRLASYRNFPSYVSQTKSSLAEAGFFYSGKDDLVYCFCCGQGLKSWEPNDEPWVEHAIWSPKCVYLSNVKGNEFIHSVQQPPTYEKPEMINEASSINNNRTECINTTTGTPTGILMDTIAAESLISCGYERTMIRKAIKIYVKEHGNSEFKATDIVSIIFALEDGSIDCKENGNEISTPKTSNRKSNANEVVCRKSTDNITESKALLEENKQLKDQTCCKICLEETVSIVFLPCGHLCSCAQCAPALQSCPICRTHIRGTVKTFLS